MFNKKENKLSIILYKYKDIINYNDIKNNKLKYSVKAHLNGKLHMKTLYLDNVPVPIRYRPQKLEHIGINKYKWNICNQEEFISNSDWFETEIKPLIAYDVANKSNKFFDFSGEIFKTLFGDDNNLKDIFDGQFLFSNVPKDKCLKIVLAFVLLYYNNIKLKDLLKKVRHYYPIKHRDKDDNILYRNIILLLTKWRKKGYVSCNNLIFAPRKMFFIKFLNELK